MDEKLDWSEHIKNCNAKISSAFYAIHSSKKYLISDHLLMLYNALVYPYPSYGILLWGATYQTHTDKVIILQKKAIRTVAQMPYNSHTYMIFKQLHILKFIDIYNLYLGKYMYLQINKILPEPLLRCQSLCRDIHSHNTRQISLLHKQTRRTVFVANSFIHKGPDYWNSLPEIIKTSLTVTSFNTRHKYYLLNKS